MGRFRSAALAVAGIVAAVVVLVASGVLPDRASVAVNDLGQLLGGVAAAVACAVTGARSAGAERRWRLLLAAGFAGWTCGQALWTWSQVVSLDPIPSPSLADVGYLTLPVFALPALMVLAAAGRQRGGDPWVRAGRSRSVLVLDALVIVGSTSILTWSTALSAVVRAGAPTGPAFAVAVAYPISDLVLVVIAVLMLTLRRLERRRTQLLLLVLGLVAISVSDSVFAWLVSSGAGDIPEVGDIGFVAGPFLVALAALAPVSPPPRHGEDTRSARWRLLVPYLPLAAVGVLLLTRTALGHPFGSIEVYLGLLVVALVVTRQYVTLRENVTLLESVQRGREELTHQAFHDALTGLPNRALFGDRLAHAAEVHRDERRPLGLLFVDLDDFKTVNDTLGHAAGDALLRQVAGRLRECVSTADTVARLGGDEFAVLVESDLDPADVADRVCEALARPFPLDARVRSIRASIGLVVPEVPDAVVSAELLLRRADYAMYTAKRRGGGAVVRYDAGLVSVDDPGLPARLADAVREGRIEVVYQPIVRLSDATTVAVEALARWTDGERGPVPPEVFIAAAERTGVIGALDDAVLDRACRDMAALRASSRIPLAVHVNVSASRLADPALEDAVHASLRRHGLPAAALVLEITETAMVPELTAAVRILQRLRESGIRLALDDFGTGYGTLANLHVLPIDVVKLDRTLTVPAGDPERAGALRRSVVSISRTLGMLVVGEGIETAEQAADLHRLGCDLGQGYFFGRPVPADRLRLTPPYVPGHPLVPVRA